MRKTVAILGIPIDDLDTAQALARLDEFVQTRRFHQVATANTDFLIKARSDPELKAILREADLVVPDGMPVVAASHWLKSGLRERVTGADLVPRLAALAAQKGYRIFMLGARPEVAQAAKARMEANNPGLQIVGCFSPPVGHIVAMDNESILRDIEAAKPDILLVAFGNPKQEKWIYMHRHRLNVPVCIGVGGTFDFIAGASKRAPLWMQRAGLEWLHRLAQDPRRLWKRYVNDLVHFARFILMQLWVMRRREVKGEPSLTLARAGDCTVVSVVGPLGRGRLAEFQSAVDRALNVRTHLILDLQGTTHVDSAALGTLLHLPKRASYVEREVRLVGLSRQARRTLRLAGAEGVFRLYPTVADALRGDVSDTLDVFLHHGEAETILVLQGRADTDQAAQVCTKLADISSSTSQVLIDLQLVSYIDCGMLSLLHGFADNRKRSGGLTRFALSTAVLRTLTREKLDGLFPLTPGTPAEREGVGSR